MASGAVDDGPLPIPPALSQTFRQVGVKAITADQRGIQRLQALLKQKDRDIEILKNRLPGAPRPIGLETLRSTLIPLGRGRWLFGG
ncbi:hypothetical protein C1Y31_23345 [Pseudomonas sp. FW305-25]|uniref:Uncharacterized protein n=1 Tax=Pseudomonas chlororaphis TaxID=587753 RepID=A0AB34C2Y1_9PSED|nr:hypothetical protein F2A38_17755 [Pseudomonas chlororaphis]PMY62126.1 hypothetical protein C1Y31_23345 [Pseudomonas sp. FW305-25]PMY63751.1 hypothetical protein C1Y32_26120 [Pseudomonas sp. FW126-L8]PNA76571.1 hypothetical protein C1Y33_20080 [Pseudomonas sp. FW305-76]